MDKLTKEEESLRDFRNTWFNEGDIEIAGVYAVAKEHPEISQAIALKSQLDAIMDPICDWIYDKKLKR